MGKTNLSSDGDVPGGYTQEFTFSTGKKARIRPMSPLLLQKLRNNYRKRHPPPEPPMQEVETLSGKELIPNEADPVYIKAQREWGIELGNYVQEFMIRVGVQVEIDDAELDWWLDQLAGEGIETDDMDRKQAWIEYVCIGSPSDLTELASVLAGMAGISKEAIAEAVEGFRSPVPGTRP